MTAELRRFVTPEIVFGVEARLLAGRYASQLGASRVLVVSDEGVDRAGWTAQVVDSLVAEGLNVRTFLDLSPNPRTAEVAAGAEAYREHHSDFLVAVGGGSPIDCAKGIGVVVAHDRDVAQFEGIDRLEEPIPPLICVPTTGGSGADVSQFAVITDESRRVKFGLISKALVPDVSLVDPETLTTMSAELTAASGMDALSHAIEAAFSTVSWPFTDMQALSAMRLIADKLADSQRAPDDLELRAEIMRAATCAGLAFSNAGLGVVHAMAHALGGFADAAHGAVNAVLLAGAIEFNGPSLSPETVAAVAHALHATGPTVDAIAERVRGITRSLHTARHLSELGVTKDVLPALSAAAQLDATLATTPRFPTTEDLLELYERAL